MDDKRLKIRMRLHNGEIAEIPADKFPAELTVIDVDTDEEVKCNVLHVKEKPGKKPGESTVLIYCS